jgi:uncharacterized protein (TIGR02145 family)
MDHKHIFLTLFYTILVFGLAGQAPAKFGYQGVVRGENNEIVSQQTVGIYIAIKQGDPQGNTVFEETHQPQTNVNGLFSIDVGTGESVSGNLNEINWSDGPYFLQSDIDPNGGTNYTLSGVMELGSVPYALYANGTLPEGSSVGEMLYWDGEEWIGLSSGNDNDVLTFCDGVPLWRPNGECPTSLPVLSTIPVSSIGSFSAISGGNISNDGNDLIVNRGVCYDTQPLPNLSDNVTNEGSGEGAFSSQLTGLLPNTTYYIRAYAENGVGVAFGNEISFTTDLSPGTGIVQGQGVLDIEGNFYPSIILPDGQEWMAKNLSTTKYPDGSDVIAGPTADGSQAYSSDNGYRSCLENLSILFGNSDCSDINNLGYLYQWSAVMAGSSIESAQGICPNGWHVPSDAEWKNFEEFLGMEPLELDLMGWRGTDQGSQMAGNPFPENDQNWGLNQNPNTDIEANPAFNSSGFNAPAPGTRYSNGDIYARGFNSYFWTSTQVDSNLAVKRGLNANETGVMRDEGEKALSFSVRCVKD